MPVVTELGWIRVVLCWFVGVVGIDVTGFLKLTVMDHRCFSGADVLSWMEGALGGRELRWQDRVKHWG